MISLNLPTRLRVLCLAAHCDDIEIGCGATLLSWAEQGTAIDATWFVAAAGGPRGDEQRASAERYFARFESGRLELGDFPDAAFPTVYAPIKQRLVELAQQVRPDLIFTHRLEDRHQDHRLIGELTWNVWRDSLVLEYEIPKWEGDLDRAAVLVPVSEAALRSKLDWLGECHRSQRSKDWFDPELFRGLARLRGAECRSPSRWAEGFHARKLTIGAGQVT
ncbi:MAG TPA: PIG-L family deacetylase [Pirellulaceae bacterium]|nr:PIG-L family deacetylase [Pirellulaceae bacterium]